MATRIVTGLIRAPNGEPWPQFTLAFTVSPSTYRPDAHYPHQTVRVTTEEDGTFEAELVTNVRYLLDLESAFVRRGSSTGYPGESKNIPLVVPDGDGPISLEELRGLDGIDPDVPDVKALIEQIIADYLAEHGGMVPHTHPMDQVVGLDDALGAKADAASLADVATSGSYSDLDGVPAAFPPLPHDHDDSYTPLAHATNTDNPHGVTASQTGAYTTAETDNLLAGKVDTASLANIATTGSYDDLADVPGAFPPEPHDHDGVYVKPESLADVATSGDYADLANTPAQFDGDYGSLTNVPETFPPEPHNHDSEYAPLSHASDTDNPHNVTAGQVGAYTKAEVDAAIEDSGGFPGFDGTGTASTAARSDHHHDGMYAPSTHQHDWDEITDKPSAFQPAAHDHAWGEITDKPTEFPPATHNHDGMYSPIGHDHSGEYVEPADLGTAASADITDFAPASHSHTWESVTGKPSEFPPSTHNHTIANVANLQSTLDGKAAATHSHAWNDVTDKPTAFTPTSHGHAIADVTNLQSSLDGKAATSHNHAIGNVTGLQSALDGKASTSHTHTLTGSIQFTFNGGGAAIEAGAEAVIRMNFAGTFTGWDIYSAHPGSFVGTVGKATHSDYPTFTAISGTSKPTLASQNKNQSTTLTGWATSFAAGDVIRIVVDSAATVEQVAVSLRYTRTV